MAAVKVTKVIYEEIDSARFRQARIATGLSAVALCRKAGVHDQFVSRLERGLTKEIPQELLETILEAMAGEGTFEGQGPDAVLAYMKGEASFTLRLVKDDSQPNGDEWVARESNPEPTDSQTVAPLIRPSKAA